MRTAMQRDAAFGYDPSLVDGNMVTAWLERDHSRLNGPGDVGDLCVELKPKAGLIPPGAPLGSLSPPRCRFCLYATIKAQKARRGSEAVGVDAFEAVRATSSSGTTAAPVDGQRSSVLSLPRAPPEESQPCGQARSGEADYCPLDLYSTNRDRMGRAVAALMRRPRNNLRVYDSSSGRRVFGGASGPAASASSPEGGDAVGLHQWLRRAWLSAHADEGACSSAQLLESALVAVLLQEAELLRCLRSAQGRAVLGSGRAMALHTRGSELAGGEAALHALIELRQARATSPTVEVTPTAGPSHREAGFGGGTGGCDRAVDDHSLVEIVDRLAEWLLGLCASDVSLMVSLGVAHTVGDSTLGATPPTSRPQAEDGDSGLVVLPLSSLRAAEGGRRREGHEGDGDGPTACFLRYRIHVVDTCAKPPTKVREHWRLDRQIVQHWQGGQLAAGSTAAMAATTSAAATAAATAAAATVATTTAITTAVTTAATLMVAFGTRGDVAPLLAIARSDRLGGGTLFATHDCHRSLVLASAADREAISFVGVPTDPLRPGACTGASVAAEHEPILSALTALESAPSLVILNLFSLGGWHLAEHLGVPCVVLSPCVVPYSLPVGFEEHFAATHPRLYAALRDGRDGCVSWSDVATWMWPLWNDARWGAWRRTRLGLPEAPLFTTAVVAIGGTFGERATATMPLPPPTPLLYCIPSVILPRPAFWPPAVRVVGSIAPAPADAAEAAMRRTAPGAFRLLHGASARRTLYVGFGSCSPLLLQDRSTAAVDVEPRERPPSNLAEAVAYAAIGAALALPSCAGVLLHACGCDRLCEHWGEVLLPMARQCEAISDDERCFTIQARAEGGDTGAAVCNEGAASIVVVVVRGELPLAHVFGRALVTLHHGGMGTCAEALHAGAPQCVLPLVFDQFANAERLEHVGLGARLERVALLAGTSRATPPPGGGGAHGICVGSSGAEHLRGVITRLVAGKACTRATAEQVIAEDGLAAACAAAVAARADAVATATAHPLLAAARRWKRSRPADIDDTTTDDAPSCSVDERRAGASEGEPTRVGVGEGGGGGGGAADTLLLPLPDGSSVWCAPAAAAEVAYIFREIVTRACYLPPGIALPLSGGLLLDVGANIGLFTLWAAARAPEARIVACEPAPASFSLLCRNVRERGLDGRVCTMPLAIGSSASRRTLTWYARMPGNATFFADEKAAEASVCFRPERRAAMLDATVIDCEVRTLSQTLRSAGESGGDGVEVGDGGGIAGVPAHDASQLAVDLLKIDVEGSELDVLRGIDAADWPRIRQVVLETHGSGRQQEAAAILQRHYELVGEIVDEELAACGLERAIVYASRPRSVRPR